MALVIEVQGDPQAVGEDREAPASAQGSGHGFHRRADVDEDRGLVGHEAGRALGDGPLLLDVEGRLAFAAQAQRLLCGLGAGAAVEALQQAGLVERDDVPPDRLRRDLEARRELVDGDEALRLGQLENLPLAVG